MDSFRSYLSRLREEPDHPVPCGLLEDGEYAEPLAQLVPFDPPERFHNRFDFARWLDQVVGDSGLAFRRDDSNFWAWLSLALFDHVAPPDARGRRKPGAAARHIPDRGDWRRRYRHLLANPFDIHTLHRDDPGRAYVALVNPLHRPGDLTEQIAARMDIVSCPGTMALASYLFLDPKTGKARKGAAAAARRFARLINQYARTWDLPLIDPLEFAKRLPREFERFVQAADEHEAA